MKSQNFRILLSIFLSIIGTKVFAYDIIVKNADGYPIYYNYINNRTELEVTHNGFYSGYFGSVNIPYEVTYKNKTLKVKRIGQYAFRDGNLVTSVSIPNGVTNIVGQAFWNCSGLKSVTIPNSVISIGNEAFRFCSSLTSVSIPNSVTYLGRGAFNYCINLTFVTIGNNVTSIEDLTFWKCSSLTSVTIGNNVTKIGESAFEFCESLTSISIPNCVTEIGKNAFFGCESLISATIGTNVKYIRTSAFEFCNKLSSITFPSSMKKIGSSAFNHCDLLQKVISESKNPFEIWNNSFSYETYNNATLYVPKGTIDKYKATEGWKKFFNIVEGSPSGITNTESEGINETKRYTLDGKMIKNTHKGINIIQMNNGATKKVFVK